MTANLVGDLGKTISGSIGKSLAGFGAGMKGALVSGNPAAFAPAIAGLTKMMKADQTQRKQDRAFEEEKSLEQRKLFTDILGEQKKTNELLRGILEALLPKKEEGNFLQNLFRVLVGALGKLVLNIRDLIQALRAFGDFLKNLPSRLIGAIEDIIRALLKPLDFLKDVASRIGSVLDFIKDLFGRFGNALSRLLDFLGDLFKNLRTRFPALDNLFKFFEDLPRRFGDFFKDLFDRFKKLPFVDDLIKFFSDLPNQFRNRFNGVLDTFKNAFDDFKARFKLPALDDILKAFDDFKARIRLPNFEDVIRAIEGIFNALPSSFDRLRNTTLINVAILADLLDEVRANLGAKFDTFKATFTDAFAKVGSLVDDLSIKFDSLRTSTLDFFGRITAAFQDGRLALSLDDLGKIMPEILGTSGGFFEALSARFGYYFQQIVEAGGRAIKYVEDIAGPFLSRIGEIGGKILKFLIPLDVILSLFDGLSLATSEERLSQILNVDELQVSFMDRVAGFLGGSISSFIFGFFDVAVKLVDWIAGNIFGSQTWEESANLGLQTIFDEGLTVFFEQMVAFGKEVFNLLKGLFTLDGEIIMNALKSMYYIFDDFVVNIVNTMERVLDAIGVRKYLARAFNFIGSSVVGLINNVMEFFSNVTTWVAQKLGSLPDWLGGAKFREWATSSKFTPIKFEGVNETYDKKRDSVVSQRQQERQASAAQTKENRSELKRLETRAAAARAPAPKPEGPKTLNPTSFSTGYTPTNMSNQPLSVRNNNPGNLRFVGQPGAVPGEGGFARFASPEEGMEAMRRQIALDTQTRGMNVSQFIKKYAPESENNTANYINFIRQQTGLGPNDTVPPNMIPALQQAMIRMEGGQAASGYYAGVQPGTGGGFNPSLMTVGFPGQYGYAGGTRSMGGAYDTGPIMSAAGGTFGQGQFGGQFNGTISGPEQNYIRNRTILEQNVIDGIEARRPTTTAYTGQDADTRLINLNAASNEMETQNLVYQQQIATGIQRLNNQYDQQRKSLEMQFLGQIQGDISRSLYKAMGGPQGFGVMGKQNSAFGSINQLYQNSFQNFATKILGKDMGPIYGNIFSQLAASYTDQFVNTVLGPMFGPNAAQGFNRAINNYAQGATVRKQYDVLKADYDKTKVEFDKLSSQVTLVDRLNALNPLTGKPTQQKLNLIAQVDALEQLLGQKGQQVAQAKSAVGQNKKMVMEDLIYAMTGIPTGMRSLFGYEQGIQNFSQQMALMIGQPFSPLFGGAGGYDEYKRNVERQMKLGVDSQGRYMEQGALQMRDGMVYAGDYHNQGMSQVLGNHLQGMANITQYSVQSQAQIAQMQAKNSQMQMMGNMMGGGGGGGFFGTLGNIWEGLKNVGGAVMDVFSGTKSIGDAISGIFKPSAPTGGGGSIPGQTGPTGGGGMFGGGMGNMLVDFGTMYAAQKLGLGFGPATFALNQLGKNFVAGKGLTGAGDILKGGAGGPGFGGTLFSLYSLKNANVRSPGGLLNTALAAYQIYNALLPGSVLANTLGSAGSYLGTVSGATYGTGFLSQQSRMLAAQEFGMGATNSFGSMAQGIGLNLVGGLAGTFIGNAIAGDKQLIKGIGSSSIGATIGGFVGGPVGALIGGVLGGVVDSLFGMGPKKTQSAGITGTLAEGSGTQLKEYENWSQEGGKFRSDKSGRNEKAASQDLVDYMQAGVNQVFTGVRKGAEILGLDASLTKGFQKAIEVNLLGLSQADQAKKLQQTLLGFSDDLIKTAYGDIVNYQKTFGDKLETITETFSRLAESTVFMNNAFEMLKYTSDDLAKTISGKTGFALADLKYNLMGIFGGKDLQEQQDNFNKYVGDYYKLFYTQQEQLTYSLAQKKKEFDAINEEIQKTIKIPGVEGLKIPEFKATVEESRAAYRQFVDDFVKNNDMSKAENQRIYAQLIQAGPMFYEGAQQFVELNKVQNKKKTREELMAEGAALTGQLVGAAGSIGAGVFGGDFANSLNTAAGSLDYISTTLSATPTGGVIPTSQGGAGSQQFLSEQNMLNNGGIGGGAGTNVNTVVDNSVRQVSSPITTFVMQDDKVRDFHPILRNTERSSLRAYTLAMR